ncbi:hypothetical protein AHAS_Ahas19G0045000 [Arachis hypogaea]
MPKGMSKLKHLNFLSDYIVSEQEENGMRELGTLDNLHGSFCISKLENVKNSGEALKAKMGNKKHINTLKLKWVPDGDIDDIGIERDILDKLQPHENLNKLSIKGYPEGSNFRNPAGAVGIGVPAPHPTPKCPMSGNQGLSIFKAAYVPIQWEEHYVGTEIDPRTQSFLTWESLESVRSIWVGLKGPMANAIGKGHHSWYANFVPAIAFLAAKTQKESIVGLNIRL